MNKSFVFDTNVLISAFLNLNSIPSKAFRLAKISGKIILSTATLEEFIEVLYRPKFNNFLSEIRKKQILNIIKTELEIVVATESINDCRDPRDNKFLEIAVSSNASCLITGDNDLLILHPYRNIPIVRPTDFINTFLIVS